MSKLVIKNGDLFVFQGSLVYEALQKDWNKLLASFFQDGAKRIILDMESVHLVDSSFLAFLLALLRCAHQQHVSVKIQHITEDIKHLMQVQGIWPLFQRLV